MDNTIVEPRRILPEIIKRYVEYTPGGVQRPVHYALVNYNINFRQVKAFPETAEHHEAVGEFIMVSRVQNSSVVFFELAPKYGRLWHKNHLTLDPYTRYNGAMDSTEMPPGLFPPIAYLNIDVESRVGEYIDPLSNFRHLYDAIEANDRILTNESSRCMRYCRLRTPKEFAYAIGAEYDHPLVTFYRAVFPKLITENRIPDTECIFSASIQDYNMKIDYYGRKLSDAMMLYIQFHNDRVFNGNESPPVALSGIIIDNFEMVYPPDSPMEIRHMSIPFAYLDFSVGEFLQRGASGFIKVKVPEPDTLPVGYHFPHVWNLMVGETIITPFIYVDHDEITMRIYTPAGNSIPAEYFEIINE